MKLAERMETLVLTHGDLMHPGSVASFSDLVAHVESWRILISRWDDDHTSAENSALIPYPQRLDSEIEERFLYLLEVPGTFRWHLSGSHLFRGAKMFGWHLFPVSPVPDRTYPD